MRNVKTILIPLALLVCGLTLAAATPTSAPSAPPAGSADKHRIIVTRNIFSKDRRPPSEYRPPTRSYQPPTRAPEPPSLILSGIGLQDDARIAFFEDPRTGEIIRASAGQKFEKGIITEISLDGLEFATERSTRKVHVGETLSGAAPAYNSYGSGSVKTPSTTQPTSGPTSGPADEATTAPTPASAPADDTPGLSDVEKRMRQRRLELLGQ